MTVWVLRDGELVDKATLPPPPAPEFPMPMLISDYETVSPIDGSYQGSRKAYKDHLKSHGCEIVGNDRKSNTEARLERMSDRDRKLATLKR